MIKRILGFILILFVTACSKGGGGSNGEGPAPSAAVLLLPVKDQPCTSGTVISATESSVSFSWSAAQNTDSYDLSIKNLLTQTETTQTTSGTQATVKLLRNTPYSWYVTSKSQSNKTITKSDIWKFYNAGAGIVTYAPFPAEIVAPTLGQIVTASGGKINLSWKGSTVNGSIAAYNVYFGPSNNPDLYKNQITDSFLNGISVSSNTTYYWHVVSIDQNGNVADSGLSNFFVKQ